MVEQLQAIAIMEFHDEALRDVTRTLRNVDDSNDDNSVWHWTARNHRYNILLWHEEDKARRRDVPAEEIAQSKRLIDGYNQHRNDAVEAIDECILLMLGSIARQASARLSSETAGAMIDRLSILSLKIFHMDEQTRRGDVDASHVERCRGKLLRLVVQRNDLGHCFDRLMREAFEGCAYFKVYRQFKMYNDATLNPYLDAQQTSTAPARRA